MPTWHGAGGFDRRLTVRVRGEIDDRVVNRAIEEIDRARRWKCRVTMLLTSPGGDVLETEKLAAAIRRQNDIDVLVEEYCHSSALMLLASCRGERAAERGSAFVWHRASSSNPAGVTHHGRFTAVAARVILQELRHTDRQIISALAAGFACPDRAEVEALMNMNNGKGALLSAEEMFLRGYIHELIGGAGGSRSNSGWVKASAIRGGGR
jgi:hypothetical protein